jgi:hypothetical protein
MVTGGMTKRTAKVSPRLKAILASAFYLLMMLSGGLALFARLGLVVMETRRLRRSTF